MGCRWGASGPEEESTKCISAVHTVGELNSLGSQILQSWGESGLPRLNNQLKPNSVTSVCHVYSEVHCSPKRT